MQNDTKRRIISTVASEEDIRNDDTLRPKFLTDYIGQKKAKEMMKVYIEAAKGRKEPLDFVLLQRPPITSGPAIEKPGDVAAILNNLKEGDVLFVDEIHRLNRQVEEVLYPAMEDFAIDVVIGKGATSKSIRLELPKFTLIGATTRAGMLSAPLRDRFGVVNRLEYYTLSELKTIIVRSAGVLGVKVDEDAALEMARRSRGTPRLANRLLKRVRDFAEVKYDGKVTKEVATEVLALLNIDSYGLDHIDREILTTMIEKFNGGPVGLETIAVSIGEDTATIEDVYEPYLIQSGFLARTQRGRIVTDLAYTHLGLR